MKHNENTMKTKETPFNQLCVWEGTLMGGSSVEDFEKHAGKILRSRLQFVGEVKTLPLKKDGEPIFGTGGRNDLFFKVHDEDIPRLTVEMLRYGVRWWKDVVKEGQKYLYPKEFLDKHSIQ